MVHNSDELRGYNLTVKELQTKRGKLLLEKLATTINPGIAPRYHISPRWPLTDYYSFGGWG